VPASVKEKDMGISPEAPASLDLDGLLVGLPPAGAWTCLVEIGDVAFGLGGDGPATTVVPVTGINDSWDFEFAVGAADWSAFCSVPRPRGYTTAQAMVATSGARPVRGDRAVWARAAVVVDRVLDALRDASTTTPAAARNPEPPASPLGLSPIVGRYLTVEVDGARQRLYYESAGTGPALVCLHTAGADSRQFRYLLEDPELTARWTVVAFDMPWHGRSEPPTGWQEERRVFHVGTEPGLDQAMKLGSSPTSSAPSSSTPGSGRTRPASVAGRSPGRSRTDCAPSAWTRPEWTT
jgi:hypothetical protein